MYVEAEEEWDYAAAFLNVVGLVYCPDCAKDHGHQSQLTHNTIPADARTVKDFRCDDCGVDLSRVLTLYLP
jgi:hypothetical protein